jgi:chromosome segregation ATPase
METGTVISLAAVVISFAALILNSKKETKSDAASMARIETSLATLNSGVNDIRVDLRSMRDSLADHSERLARVEAKAENNTHRLDVIEGKVSKGE